MDTYDYEPESVEMMRDEDETSSNSSSSNDSLNSINSNENHNYNSNQANKEAINGNFQFTISNEHISVGYNPNLLTKSSTNEENEEDEERKRFQIELEFVQSLANPNYLNFLAQHGYFKNPTFLNYLKYLTYWKEPEYNKYLAYPQCLTLLELLLHKQFLKEIVNAQCSKFVDEQLLLVWLHYKRRRDSMRIDPTRIPPNIETLNFEELAQSKLKPNGDVNIEQQQAESSLDPFSIEALMAIEKF